MRAVGDVLPPPDQYLARYRVAIVSDVLAAANVGASLMTTGRVARLTKADAAKAAKDAEAVLDESLIAPLRDR